MDFFGFLENQAAAELQHRRSMELSEVNAMQSTADDGRVTFLEGQPAQISAPSWVVPVAIGAALIAVVVLMKD